MAIIWNNCNHDDHPAVRALQNQYLCSPEPADLYLLDTRLTSSQTSLIMRWLLTNISLSLFLVYVSAHGFIQQITTSTGQVYNGWDPISSNTSTPPYPLVAWSASNQGNGFVPPSQFNSSNITCHDNALPGALHVNVSAGDTLTLKWNEWPVSHVGTVMTYMASCNNTCAEANKDSLSWVKIDELAWLNSTGWEETNLGGTWATDVLIANNFSWIVKIPKRLAAGHYVLRHEIIALHVAEKLDGAQAYPQCVNLRVERGDSTKAKHLGSGVRGTKLYGAADEGILVNVHGKITGYKTPGPKLWKEATPVRQPYQ
jgi:cellulase